MHSIDPIGSARGGGGFEFLARGGGGFEFLVKRTERFDGTKRTMYPTNLYALD